MKIFIPISNIKACLNIYKFEIQKFNLIYGPAMEQLDWTISVLDIKMITIYPVYLIQSLYVCRWIQATYVKCKSEYVIIQ